MTTQELLARARQARGAMALADTQTKDRALLAMAEELEADMAPILAANALAGTDRLELTVCGHEDHTIVTARFDNLGKGASGAAVQNMNLMLGFGETEGLSL